MNGLSAYTLTNLKTSEELLINMPMLQKIAKTSSKIVKMDAH
jgi:hypothetical protein